MEHSIKRSVEQSIDQMISKIHCPICRITVRPDNELDWPTLSKTRRNEKKKAIHHRDVRRRIIYSSFFLPEDASFSRLCFVSPDGVHPFSFRVSSDESLTGLWVLPRESSRSRYRGGCDGVTCTGSGGGDGVSSPWSLVVDVGRSIRAPEPLESSESNRRLPPPTPLPAVALLPFLCRRWTL